MKPGGFQRPKIDSLITSTLVGGNSKRIKHDIPICSICHIELVNDLAATPCGHVFHYKW